MHSSLIVVVYHHLLSVEHRANSFRPRNKGLRHLTILWTTASMQASNLFCEQAGGISITNAQLAFQHLA